MALIYFSIGGKFFTGDPVKFVFEEDRVMDYSHDVKIDLKNKIGKYVKIKLFFDTKWIMISEVEFDSCKLFTILPFISFTLKITDVLLNGCIL